MSLHETQRVHAAALVSHQQPCIDFAEPTNGAARRDRLDCPIFPVEVARGEFSVIKTCEPMRKQPSSVQPVGRSGPTRRQESSRSDTRTPINQRFHASNRDRAVILRLWSGGGLFQDEEHSHSTRIPLIKIGSRLICRLRLTRLRNRVAARTIS